jgi:hypothetical protein
MTLLDVFIPFKPFLSQREDWSHCMIERFKLNDIAGCVHSIQTILAHSEDWSHAMIESFELNDTAGCVHAIQTISST